MKKIISLLLMMVFLTTNCWAAYPNYTVCPSSCDFTSLNGAVADIKANHATLDQAVTITMSGTWASADTTAVDLSSITTSGTNTLTISATGTARHPGYWSDTSPYWRLKANSNGNGLLTIEIAHVFLNGLQIDNTNTANSNSSGIWLKTGAGVIGDGIIAISNSNTGSFNSPGLYENINNLTYSFYNSTFIGRANDGVDVGGGTVKFYNCVFVSGAGAGFNKNLGSGTTASVYNSYATGTTAGYGQNSGFISITTSASSDGSRSTTSVPYTTSTFNNVTSGSEDFALVNGSGLIGIGTNESGVFTDDIILATRQASGAWDVGAYYFNSASALNVTTINNATINNATIY